MHQTRKVSVSKQLWLKIEILNWALNEILVLSQNIGRVD